jgi:hypothetical protein
VEARESPFCRKKMMMLFHRVEWSEIGRNLENRRGIGGETRKKRARGLFGDKK